MIVFKQKQGSTRATQTIFKLKSAGNKVAAAINKSAEKSKIQIARESIQTRNALKPANIKGKIIDTALNTSKKLENAVYRPGHAVNKGIELVATNPAAAVTYVATAPLPVSSLLVSSAVNKAAKKVPAYTKITNRLGNAWKNSGVAKKLDTVTGFDLSRYAQMVPIH